MGQCKERMRRGYEPDKRPAAMFSQWARDRVINGTRDASGPSSAQGKLYMLQSAVEVIGKIGVSVCPAERACSCKSSGSNPLRRRIPDIKLIAWAKLRDPGVLEQMVVRAMLPWSIGRPAHGAWGSEWFRLDVDNAVICWNAIRVLISHSDAGD